MDPSLTNTSEPFPMGGKRVSPGQLNALVAALLMGLALLFVSPGLPPWGVAAPMKQLLVYPPWHTYYPGLQSVALGGDLLLQQLPWRHWMQQELAAGRFPLWDPAPMGGLPLFANTQVGVLYPLNLLWVLFPIGPALGFVLALKLWLAGLGMWLFLRAMDLHPSAALLSALGLMFSAWMVDLLPWQLTGVYLLLPWMAWAAYAWCRQSRRAALPALAILSALTIFAGHPETLFIVGVTLALWALSLLSVAHPRRLARQAAGLALSAVLGLALGAVQFLPLFQALELSHTALQRRPSAAAASFHLETGLMSDWLLPRTWGHFGEGVLSTGTSFTEGNGYVGLVALLGLAFVVAAAWQRRLRLRLALPWVAIGLFAWLVTYDGTLGTFIRGLPGFSQNVNVRWVSIVAFSALVASAFGWDWFARRIHARPASGTGAQASWPQGRLGTVGIVLLVEGVALMAIHAAGLLPPPQMESNGPWLMVNDNYRFYWIIWTIGVALAALGASALWAAKWRGPRVGFVLLCAIVVVDLWRLLFTVNGTAPASQYYPQTSFLQQVKDLVPSPERILVEGEGLPPNTAMVYDIRDWRAQDALLTERAYQATLLLDPDLPKDGWSEYNMFLNNLHLPVAPLLGMRYFIFPAGTNPNTPGLTDSTVPAFTRLAYKEGLGLWRAEGVPGFAYLSDNVQVAAGEPAARAWAHRLTWEQTRRYPAMVEAPPTAVEAIRPDPAHTSPGKADITIYTPGHIRLQISASRPALLVVAESWYPGWRATLDGKPVDLLRANYLSQGVVVPAGEHTVDLHYVPDTVTNGAWISALAALAIALLFLIALRARPKQKSSQ
jgi:hypothetical protein